MKPTTDREAITLILKGLQEAGWSITHVADEEEVYFPDTIATAVGHVTDVDIATVYVRNAHGTGWVWFVLGNDPEEVASDFSVNISSIVNKITDPWWE